MLTLALQKEMQITKLGYSMSELGTMLPGTRESINTRKSDEARTWLYLSNAFHQSDNRTFLLSKNKINKIINKPSNQNISATNVFLASEREKKTP